MGNVTYSLLSYLGKDPRFVLMQTICATIAQWSLFYSWSYSLKALHVLGLKHWFKFNFTGWARVNGYRLQSFVPGTDSI